MKFENFCNQFDCYPDLKDINHPGYLLYFLVNKGEIVYVGKASTLTLSGRLDSHRSNKEMQFDCYFVIHFSNSEKEALKMEAGFISLIRPKFNKSGKRVDVKLINFLISRMSELREKSPSPVSDKRCRTCGKPFEAKTKRAKYCSTKCRNDYNNAKR